MSDPAVLVRDLDHHLGRGALRAQVLHRVSIAVSPGEVVLVTGPSGSGKTTLLTLIGGLRRVRTGSVRVLGCELRGASEAMRRGVRRRVGFVFQQHRLLPALTVRQNLQMAQIGAPAAERRRAAERIAELLAAVALDDRAERHPGELSVGERQRVAVARALVARPPLVLADEPTAALDASSGRRVAECLTALARRHGSAVLLVSHDDRIFDVADRTLRLVEGRVCEQSRQRDAAAPPDPPNSSRAAPAPCGR